MSKSKRREHPKSNQSHAVPALVVASAAPAAEIAGVNLHDKTPPPAPPDTSNGTGGAQTGSISSIFGVGIVLILDLCAAVPAGGFSMLTFGGKSPSELHESFVGMQIGTFVVSAVVLGWIAWNIWRPSVRYGTFSRVTWHNDYAYCSTHPSYVVIDLLTLPLWIYYALDSAAKFNARPDGTSPYAARNVTVFSIGCCLTVLSIAIWRLICWHGFQRRIDPEDSNRAWVPVGMFLGCLVFLAVVIVGGRLFLG